MGGKPNRGVFKPGEYADHNIIDRRGAEGMFVGFDPAKFVYDLRLKSGAKAIGAGNSEEAPLVDIAGTPRGSRVDLGAYHYNSPKSARRSTTCTEVPAKLNNSPGRWFGYTQSWIADGPN